MANQVMDNQSIDMQRAKHAYKQVMDIQKNTKYGHYVSYVKGLPATILQNGLGQALATLLAAAKGKKEEPHRLLYNQIEDWLCKSNELSPYQSNGDNNNLLMQQITENDEDSYLYAQAEVLAYLSWLKKFSAAYLQEKEHSSPREEE